MKRIVPAIVASGCTLALSLPMYAADADLSAELVGGHTASEWVGGAITALGVVVGATIAFGFVMLMIRKGKAAFKRT